VGALTALLTNLKAVPVGYMRDLQEDKVSYLEAAALISQCLVAISTGFEGLHFRQARLSEALASGFTQATDLAERLVARGIPFRTAYRAIGALVKAARTAGKALHQLSGDELRETGGAVTQGDLRLLSPAEAVEAKQTPGGAGPESMADQLEGLKEAIAGARARASATPRLAELIDRLGRD
jgi:argininosuccinate lyase